MQEFKVTGGTNTTEQLASLPLKGEIGIVFSGLPIESTILENIHILDLGKINPSFNLDKSYSDYLSTDLKREIDPKIRIDGRTVYISPTTLYNESSQHLIYIDSQIKSNVTEALKNDSETTEFNLVQQRLVDKDQKYELIALSNNFISNTDPKKNIVSVRILKNGTELSAKKPIDINQPVIIDDLLTIKFEDGLQAVTSGTVFKANILTKELNQPYKIFFKTGTAETLGDNTGGTTTSSKVTADDLFKFYKTLNKGAAADGDTTSTGGVDATLDEPYKVSFMYPDTFVIEFKKEFDKQSIKADNITLDIGYAFGNYNLEKMGLYNPNTKFLLLTTIQNNKRIKIQFKKDTQNKVPQDKQYLIEIL